MGLASTLQFADPVAKIEAFLTTKDELEWWTTEGWASTGDKAFPKPTQLGHGSCRVYRFNDANHQTLTKRFGARHADSSCVSHGLLPEVLVS